VQRIVPGAVLVGGTAAAVHARHRISEDADHTVRDLGRRFDAVLARLEALAGWKTARVRKPVLILGSLDGIEIGVRQLLRRRPLETRTLRVGGARVRVPSAPETLRIKALLVSRRGATRDFLDFVALAEHLGRGAFSALESLDRLYEPGPSGHTVLQDLLVRLSDPRPVDLDEISLEDYKGLAARWRDWRRVAGFCRDFATSLADRLLKKS